MVCDTCGQRHHRCDGHHARTGQPCQQRPKTGERLCTSHSQPDTPAAPCGDCGQPHDPRKCTSHANIYDSDDRATRRIIGKRPCQQRPAKGLKVCHWHGGAARQSKAAALLARAWS